MLVCVVYVVIMVELVVICCCYDHVVDGEICEVLEGVAESKDGGGVDVVVVVSCDICGCYVASDHGDLLGA